MSKLIKQIYDLINLATDKGLTNYHTRDQICNAVDEVQITLFRELVKDYPKNKRVRNDLLPFEVFASITIASKIGSLPSDFEQEIEFFTAGDIPITMLESGFFRMAINDKVAVPSLTHPIGTINYNSGKKLEVSPDFTPVKCRYWKLPTKPVYAVTTLAGQEAYDDTNSTDVLWSRGMHDIIVERTLKPLGLNLREGMLVQVGAGIPKEATI